jgi:hypothetical protein
MSKHLFSVKVRVSLGLLCLSVVCGAPLHAQSLEDTVAMALDTHPDIRQSFARFKSKEEEVNQAKAGYLPTVDLTAGYGYEYTDSPGNRRTALGFNDGDTELGRGEFGVSLRQMIFDGMFTRHEVLRTKFEASAEQWALISTAEDLALRVSQAYLNYLKTEQLVALAETNVSSHEIIYSQIKERTDSGLGSIADFSQISGQVSIVNLQVSGYFGTEMSFESGDPYIIEPGLSLVGSQIIPGKHALHAAFPNPFNPVVKIPFEIGKQESVSISVFNLNGKAVESLIQNRMMQAGRYQIEWDGRQYASGMYLYSIQAGEFRQTKKVVLLK